MSETEKLAGKIQLKPRLENETDKDYFERVTGLEYEVNYSYPEPHKYCPENIYDAIYEHDITYYETKHGKKGYVGLNNNLYEILELKEKGIEDYYCNVKKLDNDIYEFEAQYYNGGCSLEEALEDGFEDMDE